MSPLSDAQTALEWLEQLRGQAAEFAKKEARLHARQRLREHEADQDRAARLDAVAETLRKGTEALDETVRVGAEKAEAHLGARKERLRKAHLASRQAAIRSMAESETLRRYELQRERIRLDQARETGLKTTQAHHEAAVDLLGSLRRRLERLQTAGLRALRGFSTEARALQEARRPPSPPPPDQPAERVTSRKLAALDGAIPPLGESLKTATRGFLPGLFAALPLPVIWLLLVLLHVGLWFGLRQTSLVEIALMASGASLGLTILLSLALWLIARKRISPAAQSFTRDWSGLYADVLSQEMHNARWVEEERVRLTTEHLNTVGKLDENWKGSTETSATTREARLASIDRKLERAETRRLRLLEKRQASLREARDGGVAALEKEARQRRAEIAEFAANEENNIELEIELAWAQLTDEWRTLMLPLAERIGALQKEASRHFPGWAQLPAETWKAPERFPQAVPFATMEVNSHTLCAPRPAAEEMPLRLPGTFDLPLLLTYPRQGSLLLVTEGHAPAQAEAASALNQVVLRLLASSPPGRAAFTVLDPVGLGENFAGLMHLADRADHLIHGKIWTQPEQIEKRLAELTEHMEKVIQMYLRNEFETITEYNEQAGNIAEKYRFLVVADFPAGFSDAAARRLLSIATSGARCGVFTLIHWDKRRPQPQDLVAEELERASTVVKIGPRGAALPGRDLPGTTLLLEPAPAPAAATALVQRIGQAAVDSDRVEVPFSHVAPASGERWSLESGGELRVPIGRSGATKLQYLALGKATRQHALVAGKTGSGKSTLFHILVTNLALWYSPDEVEFYLVDFKKGVEFKCYATHRLPHARVVAIESDREFGLSVLERLDEELRRRGELFRQLGVQDLAGYRREDGREPLPRTLLLIDEFQEFFTQEDGVAQSASLLLDRIVRQGRAFGIHAILGSQTLGGAYTLARATLGQMVVRIALQCNEADAYLIMDDSNPAPRLLSRPGEGIYNDTAGSVEGNSPFQTVWLSDGERDRWLQEVRQLASTAADGRRWPAPVVFEGNLPGDIAANERLAHWLDASAGGESPAGGPPRVWLGSPNAIKGPTETVFDRQSGSHLLIVGQRDEAILALFSAALAALAAQLPGKLPPPMAVPRFTLLDASPPESAPRLYLDRLLELLPHESRRCSPGELPEALGALAGELDLRLADEAAAAAAPPLFLMVHGLQRFKKLRHEDDFGFSSPTFDDSDGEAGAAPADPAKAFQRLLEEGPSVGLHVIASVDSHANLTRLLGRKALGEFEKRVLFQMSANDSASLIDSTQAADLGLSKALYHNEYEGTLETFRPYSLPEPEWLEEVAERLRGKGTTAQR